MAKVKVESGGSLRKWTEVPPGEVVEGVFLGIHEGKFGPLMDLDGAGGRIVYPVPAVLQRMLHKVKVGSSISIIYQGLREAQSGKTSYHLFEMFADTDDLVTPTPRAASAVNSVTADGAAEHVPF